jgi:ABC-type nitrate/sulfonate/bicarbonate transport system permease component
VEKLSYKINVFSFVPIIGFLLLWQLVSSLEWINPLLFPPPTKVLAALWTWIQSGEFFIDIGTSFWRMLVGYCIGAIIGIFLGITMGRVLWLDRMLGPILQLFRPLPPVAIIPLIIVWLGIEDKAKIFSIAFGVFFPIWINTYLGAHSIPKNYIWSAQLLTRSTIRKFFKIMIPAAMPSIIAGLRTAIPLAFIMVYVSEIAGSSSGLGYRIDVSHLAYRIDSMMAALLVLASAGFLTDYLFTMLIKKLYPWLSLK